MGTYSVTVTVAPGTDVTVTAESPGFLASAIDVLGVRGDLVSVLHDIEGDIRCLGADQPPKWWAASADDWRKLWPQFEAGFPR
jgi:hypothetical protein